MLAVLVGLASEGAPESCAACGLALTRLGKVLEDTKSELELSKQTAEKRAASIDKVQKAQTKRWLKNEYGVELRAAVEEEVEKLCSHDTLATSKALQNACKDLVEEHEDELVRAVLDGTADDEVCAAAVDGCTAAELAAAVAANSRERRSAAVPAKPWVGRSATARKLVGTTFSDFVFEVRKDRMGEPEPHHVLAMLYHSPAEDSKKRYCAPGGGACVAKPYKTAVTELYKLAAKLNASSTAYVTCAEMDLRENELPQPLELSDPTGVQLALYVEGDKSAPKLLPAVGEPSLASIEATAFRDQLKQFASTFLKDAPRSEVVRFLSATDKADEKQPKRAKADKEQRAADEAKQTQKEDGEEPPPPPSSPPSPKPPPPPPPPPRKKAPSSKKSKAQVQAEQCEMCGVVMGELHTALRERKQTLKLSREAAARKAQKVDRVQKAQTRRWLKQEYNVEMMASLEERMEKLCDADALKDAVCAIDEADERAVDSALRGSSVVAGGEGGGFEKAACRKLVETRCRDVSADHIEDLMRRVLDADADAPADTEACAEVLPQCETARAERFFKVATPVDEDDEADEDGDADVAAAAFLARDGDGGKEEL